MLVRNGLVDGKKSNVGDGLRSKISGDGESCARPHRLFDDRLKLLIRRNVRGYGDSTPVAEAGIDRRRHLAARFDVARGDDDARAPCSAICATMARPMPRDEPLTTAAFPVRSKSDAGRFFPLHFIYLAAEPIHAAATRKAKRMCNDRRELRDRSVLRR